MDTADTDSASSDLVHWPFDESESDQVTERVSGETTAITYAAPGDPEDSDATPRWPPGVSGSGLLFDGYSTWIRPATTVLSDSTKELTVEAWVAPRSFPGGRTERPAAVLSEHSAADDEGVEFGVTGEGYGVLGVGLGETWMTVQTPEILQRYTWTHLAGVFDGSGGTLRIHVDGDLVAETSVETDSTVRPASVDPVIGKNNESDLVAGTFDRTAFNGVVDSLRISDDALSPSAIADRYATAREDCGGHPQTDYETIGPDPARYDGDPHRPQYHLIPPYHWMNEPHAPLYYDGQYHLFYQHNPQGPYWANIHWGHWVSDDLVHWRNLPPALAPHPDGVAPHGMWSGGSTIGPDGEPALLFTAGDMEQTPDQSVGIARPATDGDPDLVDWEPSDEPILERPPLMGLRENDYRDPFVWREDDSWYCLVGSGFEDGGGAALLYTSTDLEEWTFQGALHRVDPSEYPELGDVWELPVLLPLGTTVDGVQKRAFLISPVGGTADVEVYYWIGEFDADSCQFEPDHDDPRLIDYGDFHFTGPHGMVDPETGRSLLFTITQDNRQPHHHYDSGWAHSGGLPVELFLRDDATLGVRPIDELESLRERRLVSVRDEPLGAVNETLADIESDTVEIRLRYRTLDTDEYGLTVRQSPAGRERTLIRYDEVSEHLQVNCERSTLDPDLAAARATESSLVHGGTVPLDDEHAEFRVFVDRSVIETYLNQRKSITTKVYPQLSDATGMELWGPDDLVVDRLDVWELASVNH